jgi:hypothetical protein
MLTYIYFPKLEIIGCSAFKNCSLNCADFPSVKTVKSKAFNNQFLLESINLPKLETVGINIFEKCKNLKSVHTELKAE